MRVSHTSVGKVYSYTRHTIVKDSFNTRMGGQRQIDEQTDTNRYRERITYT